MSQNKEIPGQIHLNIYPTIGNNNSLIVDSEPKEIELPLNKTEKNTNLIDREWRTIEETRKEMKENNDKRHLFYLPKNTFVSSLKQNWSKSNFFSGRLNQNMLGVTDEKNGQHLILKPLDPRTETVSISFFIESSGEWHKKIIPKYPKTKHGKGCIDLNKVITKEQFVEKIFKK